MDPGLQNGGSCGQLRRVDIRLVIDGCQNPSQLSENLADYLDRCLNAAQPNLAPKTFERYKQLVDMNIKPKLGLINVANYKRHS